MDAGKEKSLSYYVNPRKIGCGNAEEKNCTVYEYGVNNVYMLWGLVE